MTVETVKLVCSVCGSGHLARTRQRSIDDRWPMGMCLDHKDKRNPWTLLVSERAFRARERRPPAAQPEDVFGELPEDERARLARPLKLHPW